MESVIRTGDLALATTLRMNGYEPVRLELADQQALWVFEDGPELLRLREDYISRFAAVEPRDYNAMLRRTREEMFLFLRQNGVTPPHQRARR